MLGDESVGDIALGEADIASVTSPVLSAVAEFVWSVSTVAIFTWAEGTSAANFGWE